MEVCSFAQCVHNVSHSVVPPLEIITIAIIRMLRPSVNPFFVKRCSSIKKGDRIRCSILAANFANRERFRRNFLLSLLHRSENGVHRRLCQKEYFRCFVEIFVVSSRHKCSQPLHVLQAVAMPSTLYTPTFTASRIIGWTAHVLEQAAYNRIFRPQSVYVGSVPSKDI